MFPRHAAPAARPPQPAIMPLPPSTPDVEPKTQSSRAPPASDSHKVANQEIVAFRSDETIAPDFYRPIRQSHNVPSSSRERSYGYRLAMAGQGRAVRGRQPPVRATSTSATKLTGKSMTRHLAQSVVQGLQSNPQFFGRLRLVTVVLFQHPQNHLFFHLP
jgi:hypothetical protein